MTVNYCPGHVGHIELTAPIYNPFTFKDAYRLLKSKCFGCHRLRIHPNKLEVYEIVLKLLKCGDCVNSQVLKAYLLHAAKQVSLVPESMLTDTKRLSAFKAAIDAMSDPKSRTEVDKVDLPNFFTKMENRINERKEDQEERLK